MGRAYNACLNTWSYLACNFVLTHFCSLTFALNYGMPSVLHSHAPFPAWQAILCFTHFCSLTLALNYGMPSVLHSHAPYPAWQAILCFTHFCSLTFALIHRPFNYGKQYPPPPTHVSSLACNPLTFPLTFWNAILSLLHSRFLLGMQSFSPLTFSPWRANFYSTHFSTHLSSLTCNPLTVASTYWQAIHPLFHSLFWHPIHSLCAHLFPRHAIHSLLHSRFLLGMQSCTPHTPSGRGPWVERCG